MAKILSSATALFLFLVPAFSHGRDGVPPVIVAPVEQDVFYDRTEALGTLRANESVVLTATVSETINSIHFEDGQRVKKGFVLVEMTSDEEHALLSEAVSRLEEAKLQYERVKPLVERGAAPVSLGDERRREFQTAEAQLRAIQSRLEDRIIRAPFDGVVGIRNISVGSLVMPGDQITTLDDDSVMKLDFSVPAIYLSEIRVGLPILARSRAYPGRNFEGEVYSIDSRIDPVTRSFIVRALIPNPDRLLKPGLFMTVELRRNQRSALVLPEEALIPYGSENAVFVVQKKDGTHQIERRQVDIGARRPGDVEVVSGIDEGELVVIHGTTTTRPGQEVRIQAIQRNNETLAQLLGQGEEGSGQ